MTILRMWSSCGPCLTNAGGAGELVRETAKFYVVRERDGSEHRVAKSNHRAHVEPCKSCRDHGETVYPNGYMD